MQCLDEYVSFAEHLADLVRPVLIEAYETGFDYEKKRDGSPVTEIDKRIEAILRKEILAHYPEHGILGEEFGSQGLDMGN
jgi:fructose-1,6-bisphosphatase/inositol monophosphatase family enzyme